MIYLVGIDLGGTFIKTAIVSHEGELIKKIEIPSEKEKGPDGVIANIIRSVRLAVSEAGTGTNAISAIGIGSPGPIDTKRGIVGRAINLPGWVNIPLRDRIQEVFDIPANLENDANAMAYAEYWKGAGRNAEIMLAYTLGTGVGGGIIIEGKLIRGATGCAGELGHMTIVPDGDLCPCGNRGCLEAYASANSLVRRTLEKIKQGANTILKEWIAEGKTLTSKLIDDARRSGDAFAGMVMREAGTYLGLGMSVVVAVLNPDVIVVGGGMMKAGEIFLEPAREEVKRRVFAEHSQNLKIVAAELGNDAGVIGAAGLLIERGIVP
ncbi:MAG: ROK family glucokinase [Candidatus Sumerlaeota bacterium]|nr:ROK family glucokinase [Candidatus Sumerlaeota bacterium]